MFNRVSISAALLALSLAVEGRFLIVERNGRAIFPRRFGQEQGQGVPAAIGAACAGEICGVLGGAAIGHLLAGDAVCGQQDHADAIIDAAKAQTDPAITANMIKLAVQYRQLEKNTPPDFTTQPPTPRNSLFCQKTPKNAELVGLVQAQDPANGPNEFFDPVTKTTVLLGAPGTTPPGGSAASTESEATSSVAVGTAVATETAATETAAATTAAAATTTAADAAVTDSVCAAVPTVTVTVTAAADAAATATETAAATTTDAAATPTVAPATPAASVSDAAATPDLSGALDFGSCTDPTIEFGPAFEGRKLSEFTFKPVNKQEFPQGSALNGNIVTNAVCNILKNTCKAPDATNAACEAGKTAFAAATKGAAADAFNLALGIKSNFATIPSAPGGGPGSLALTTKANFNLCKEPTIAFQAGNDGRTDVTFIPVNRDNFTQGPALNPAIVPNAVCDTLVNTCNANNVAIQDCADAKAAIVGLTGQAVVDKFNEVVLRNA